MRQEPLWIVVLPDLTTLLRLQTPAGRYCQAVLVHLISRGQPQCLRQRLTPPMHPTARRTAPCQALHRRLAGAVRPSKRCGTLRRCLTASWPRRRNRASALCRPQPDMAVKNPDSTGERVNLL